MNLIYRDGKIFYSGKYGEDILIAHNQNFTSADEWKTFTKHFLENYFCGDTIEDKIKAYFTNDGLLELDINTYNIWVDIFRERRYN